MENDITVILNGYKRPEYLEEQVNSILNQTVKPKEIWLWVNHCDNVNFDNYLSNIDVVVKSSRNFKYHGRFSLGLLARTKYVALFDDDTIPGKKWFENCITTSKKYEDNCILGGAGVILDSKNYVYHTREGWPNPKEDDVAVDLVGHAWFLNKFLLTSLWLEPSISLDNGEDIQLSYLASKYFNTKTICPRHPLNDKDYWSSLKPWEYGNDSKASSNGSLMPVSEFFIQRNQIILECLSRGWKTINNI